LQLLGCPDQTTDWLPQEKLESLATAASITEREQEVLKLVSSGLSNREIGVQLCITPGTVKTHLANIYDKLDVHCRTQAIAEARTLQLI
jgi:LuxR family maltose regulon positive regulatory protein